MKCESTYEPSRDVHILRVEFTGGDMASAVFSKFDIAFLHGLEHQQEEDPTVEGALMIAQQWAHAIEKATAKKETP